MEFKALNLKTKLSTITAYSLKNNVLKVMKNGKEESFDKTQIEARKSLLTNKLDNLLFDIFSQVKSINLDSKTCQIGQYTCYKLNVKVAKYDYPTISYYIDNKDYLVRKMVTDAAVLTDIEYKKFGSVNLPCQYKMAIEKDNIEQITTVTKFSIK